MTTDPYLRTALELIARGAPLKPAPELSALLRGIPQDARAFVEALATHAHGFVLGQWSFHLLSEEESLELLRPVRRRPRHRHWLVLGQGRFEDLVLGWDPWKPRARGGPPPRLYAVDRKTARVRKLDTFTGWLERVARDPEEQELDEDGTIPAFVAALPSSAAPARGLQFETVPPATWTGATDFVPSQLAEQLRTGQHQAWLWHPGLGVLVSLTRKGVRYLTPKGKAKSLNAKARSTSPSRTGSLAHDASFVAVAAGSSVHLYDLAAHAVRIVPLPDEDAYCSSLAALPDGTLLLALEGTLQRARIGTDSLEPLEALEHEGLPEFPRLLSTPALDFALVDLGHETLAVGLDGDDRLAIRGVLPHRVRSLEHLEDGSVLMGDTTQASRLRRR